MQGRPTSQVVGTAQKPSRARDQLLARLQPLTDVRRSELDAALKDVRATGAELVADAHCCAAAMIVEAKCDHAESTSKGKLEPESPNVAAMIERAQSEPARETKPLETDPTEAKSTEAIERLGVVTPPIVTIDVDAFALALANAFSALFGEDYTRFDRGPQGWPMAQPAAPAAPPNPSLWSHLRHLDALLIAFIVVILLVVLAAWLA
jgi:hypothetical protein